MNNNNNNIDNNTQNKVASKNRVAMVLVMACFFVVSTLLLVACITLYGMNNNHRSRTIMLQESSYYALSEASDNIEKNLEKLIVSNSVAYNSFLASVIYSDSNIAQQSLSVLPCIMGDGIATEEFFSCVGDMALSYSALGISGADTLGYKDTLQHFYEKAKKVNSAIANDTDGIRDKISKGYMCSDYEDKLMPFSEKDTKDSKEDKGENVLFGKEYLTLAYDGKYSKQNQQREYYTVDKTSLKESDAKKIVSKFACKDDKDICLVENTVSSPLVYEYCYMDGEDKCYATVSSMSKNIISYSAEKNLDRVKLEKSEAEARAREYAFKLGYDVKVIYSNVYGADCYSVLCPIKDGVIYYTHRVKVKTSLSGGELLGLDAREYCVAENMVGFGASISKEKARESFASNLMVTDVNECVLPLANSKAIACYEFVCEKEDGEFLIYVDANSGEIAELKKIDNLKQSKIRH